MDQSDIALWVPQVQGRLTETPDGGSMTLTREQRTSVSLATISRFEYEMERLSRANPDLEIMIFDDVINGELQIKWRRRSASHR